MARGPAFSEREQRDSTDCEPAPDDQPTRVHRPFEPGAEGEQRFEFDKNVIPVTISLGVAVLAADGPLPVETLAYRDDDERSLSERLDEYERLLLTGALDAAEGSVAEAARRLRTDRANLYRRMRRLAVAR